MKVYFTCSTAKFEKYKKTYFQIRDVIVQHKHILTRDWLKRAEDRIRNGEVEIDDIKDIYNKSIQGIKESDIVIVEDTVSNFSTGHQITVALQRQKPTLVLWRGRKHRHFNKMFIHGMDYDDLEVHQYNSKNLEDIIVGFLKKYQNNNIKSRFHLVLDQVERDYLDWIQYNQGKSRTKVIRETLRQTILKDEKYNKYLRQKNYEK